MNKRILLVDDDEGLLSLIEMRLRTVGYEVFCATSGEAAILLFSQCRPQLVISDLKMGGMDGLALFDELQKVAPMVPVILLTAHGTIPDAVAATQRGVFTFLTKPFDSKTLLNRVAEALSLVPEPVPAFDDSTPGVRAIFASLRMDELLRQAFRYANEGTFSCLIGPGGSGKRLLARYMHECSPAREGPWIELTGVDESDDLESLFRVNNENSVWYKAISGVLYIPDVGLLPKTLQLTLFNFLMARMQFKDPLLRYAQQSHAASLPDVHVIVANPKSLDSALADGSFRNDLYYLLGGRTLVVPRLEERKEDIPLLAAHFLQSLGNGLTLAPDAMELLRESRWPGNIRQLQSVLIQASRLCSGHTIGVPLLSGLIRNSNQETVLPLEDARKAFELEYLTHLLDTTKGNVSLAARLAQRNRTEFYKLLAKHDLDPNSFK